MERLSFALNLFSAVMVGLSTYPALEENYAKAAYLVGLALYAYLLNNTLRKSK